MFESILRIGEYLREQGAEDIPIGQVREGYGVKIVFSLDDLSLDCEPFECKGDLAEEKAREFMWIGNPRGNTPQLRLTTNSPEYLLNPERKYKWGIDSILKYIEERNLLSDKEIKGLYQHLKDLREMFFANDENLVPKFEKVCSKKGIGLKEITLCTISVKSNGKIIDLAKEPGYRKILHHIIRYEKTPKYPPRHGKCYICGKEDEVLTNPDYPKGTFLGIYVIDKIGFLSGVSKSEDSLLRTHSVCFDCKEKLVLGMNFINKHLSVRIGDLNAWIVPTLFGEKVEFDIILCKKAFNAAKSHEGFEKIREIEERLDKIFSKLGFSPYIVNIIFGRAQQSQFIFQGLIQDVPLIRFVEVGKASDKLAKQMDKHFFGKEHWYLGFEKISNIFPLTKISGEVKGKPLIELFNAMLIGAYYPREQLLEKSLLYMRIHRFGNYGGYILPGSNVKEVNKERREEEFCRGILLYNLLLNLLVELGVIDPGRWRESLDFEGIDKDIAEFCSEQGYSDWQVGLFLLGILIGKIGIEQFKKGDRKKSILDKIDFDGMSPEKVKWLTNVVLEGLRNYRILEYNEVIYAQAKKIIDRSMNHLKNPLDNTFYVLSGYAYSTLHAITGGGGEYE